MTLGFEIRRGLVSKLLQNTGCPEFLLWDGTPFKQCSRSMDWACRNLVSSPDVFFNKEEWNDDNERLSTVEWGVEDDDVLVTKVDWLENSSEGSIKHESGGELTAELLSNISQLWGERGRSEIKEKFNRLQEIL